MTDILLAWNAKSAVEWLLDASAVLATFGCCGGEISCFGSEVGCFSRAGHFPVAPADKNKELLVLYWNIDCLFWTIDREGDYMDKNNVGTS